MTTATAGSALLALYRGATTVAAPFIARHLRARQRRGREHPERLAERTGHAGAPRPDGPLLWLHAASVGEFNATLPLLDRLRDAFPAAKFLLTSGTVTSARLAADRLPPGVLHQFTPVDTPAAVRRFYDHWRPAAGILVESEIWPNLIHTAARRAIPLALVNGRMSDKSFTGWHRVPPLARALFGSFAAVLAQTPGDRDRFVRLGAAAAVCTGNLKTAAPPPAADVQELARCRAAIAGRPCWLAAATHPGEDDAAATVHRTLASRVPGLLTIIAPRHPDRGPPLAAALRAAGFSVARRAAAGPPYDPPGASDIYIADTIGEMGLWYRLCPVAFIGNSLPPHAGGHNPMEAINLDSAVITGPATANGHFAALFAELHGASGVTVIDDAAAWAAAVATLLDDPRERDRQVAAAAAVAATKTAVLDTTLAALLPVLTPAVAPDAPLKAALP